MNPTILILGGGQAAAQAIDTLRREQFPGHIVLATEELALPYQRPPLSKKFLSGELEVERLPFRHRAFYDEHRVDLRLGWQATSVDMASGEARFQNGESIGFDQLLFATGARARQLTCLGSDLGRVHALRSIADADAIRQGIKPNARVVIVGGGYIGLETAATCVKLGCRVTVLEMADRIMNRVVAPVVSEFFARAHAEHEVRIVCNTRVAALEGRVGVERVLCDDGSVYEADMVIVGVGAIPNTEIAAAAGIRCDNGIWVDEYCRTSFPNAYAAGDCCSHPSLRFARRVRLESVDNAFEQAKTVALNLLGRNVVHDKVPWFWSDQFDLKLLIVGLSHDHDHVVVRGEPVSRAFAVCYLKGDELVALDAINQPKDYMAARKLIAERARFDLARLADSNIALKDAITA